MDKRSVSPELIRIHALVAQDCFFAVVFPIDSDSVLAGFWSTPGVGVSSRFAESNLRSLDKMEKLTTSAACGLRGTVYDDYVHTILRERIVHYLNRASLSSTISTAPYPNDVYFFPTGMASIYKTHTYLSEARPGKTVLFGMAFMNTITLFEEFGLGCKFFGTGDGADMEALAAFLKQEREEGRTVQAIWAEFPANPLLLTPDVSTLRALADEHDTILAVDDTIGSWANIDVTGVADIIVTSLTKSFNGYADVIAGSVVLSPWGKRYRELKRIFEKHYVPELYTEDAKAIERNSRDYLARSHQLNHNALSLVTHLESMAHNLDSAIHRIFYPSINESGQYYRRFMRPATEEFTPGYGCLFSIEFEDLPTTIAFYNSLEVHKGPHLGAPFTLVFAYTMCAYKNRLDWAAQHGLKATQIRISAGLEDTQHLIETFSNAIEAANQVKRQRTAARHD